MVHQGLNSHAQKKKNRLRLLTDLLGGAGFRTTAADCTLCPAVASLLRVCVYWSCQHSEGRGIATPFDLGMRTGRAPCLLAGGVTSPLWGANALSRHPEKKQRKYRQRASHFLFYL